MWQQSFGWRRASVGTKIIIPYLILTLIIAGVGAFIVTSLVTGSLQERFGNQLVDAGRIVASGMVDYEEDRLTVLRHVANTEGVAESLQEGDHDQLALLVPQIARTSNMEFVVLIDANGKEIYGWERIEGGSEDTYTGVAFSDLPDFEMVLAGVDDGFGIKRTVVAEIDGEPFLMTIGPVYENEEIVGAVIVGTSIAKTLTDLSQKAAAKITLYDTTGKVLATTLMDLQEDGNLILQEPETQYERVTRLLLSTDDIVTAVTEDKTPLRQVEVNQREYQLAYGDWRMRDRTFGFFSVALPSNFIVSTATASRNQLSFMFSLATIAVIALGFFTARWIVRPLNRLVDVSTAVTEGDLEQRTGIKRQDEIGTLAHSFDSMTDNLVKQNRQLIAQASNLEAILHSIADSVIVFDSDNHIIDFNPAAESMIKTIRQLSQTNDIEEEDLAQLFAPQQENATLTQRHKVGSRVFSSSIAPVNTPDGDTLGRVVVLRDITREAEADELRDGFITTVSHELRTPLTPIKGYIDLLKMTKENLDEQQIGFLDTISYHTGVLTSHVNKIIELSEIQSGSLTIVRTNMNLADLISESVESWKPRLVEHDLSVQLQMTDNQLWINGDAKRLQSALDNLLENAWRYTLKGGKVTVKVEHQHNQLILSIADTGIGIKPTDMPYLFTRFFRVQNKLAFNEEGVGLGLFTVKYIVELHDGQVWATSEPNVGSTFHIELPLLQETSN